MQEKMPAGYLRLRQIIGCKKAKPPIPALIPVCSTTWWNGVKAGKYPAPVKLSARTTAWTVESIKALMERIEAAQ
jgi:prophage regulatory protein